MQIEILQINHENRVGKSGKSFISCSIKTFSQNLGKGVWLKGFGDAMTETWSAGDTVDIDIEQNGEYFNWKANENTKASPDKKLEILKRIDLKLDVILGKLGTRTQAENDEIARELAKELNGEVQKTSLGNPVNPTDIDVKDIPF